jgi:nucleotide-binding universal stress UspA family protein
MVENRHIVVGVDFSPGGLAALRAAMRIRALGLVSDTTAVRVIELAPGTPLHEGLAPTPISIHDQICSRTNDEWARLEAELGALPTLHCLKPVGSVASTLLNYTQPLRQTLLILGMNGTDPFTPGAGTVAAQCARYAQCPLLLVSPKNPGPFAKIVLATDFSATAAIACRWADEVAKLRNTSFIALHALSPRDADEQAADERLRAFLRDHAPHTGATARRVIVNEANRGHAIASFVNAEHGDLLVMGRRGHSPIRHLFLGSTAERVLKQVECSLLLFSPDAG